MYTDDNLRICDHDYEELKDKYSLIYNRLNYIYDAYYHCLINIAELAFRGDNTIYNNLVSLTESVRSIEFDDIKEFSILCDTYITDIDKHDGNLYDNAPN